MTGLQETVRTYDTIAEDYLEHRRDRSVMLESIEMISKRLAPRSLVYDIGCGPGFDAAELRARGFRVVGFDLSVGMIELGAREYPGPFVRADMRHLPSLNVADALWVNASLLHIRRNEVPATLVDFRRVMKQGGVLLITLKNGLGGRWEPTAYDASVSRWFTYWSEADIRSELVKAGFEITDLRAGDRWIHALARKPNQENE